MAADHISDLSLADAPFVTLKVGRPATLFHIHRNLLCKESPVFEAAFLGNTQFEEAKSQVAELDEEDPAAFGIISKWLYTNVCKLPKYDADEGSEPYFMHLATVYAAAEKYGITHLKNDLIELLFDFKKSLPNAKPPTFKVVSYVYGNTPQNSPLRKLLVVWFTWHINLKFYIHEGAADLLNLVPDFAADLACSLGSKMHNSQTSSPLNGTPDIYYETVRGTSKEDQDDKSNTDGVPIPEPG